MKTTKTITETKEVHVCDYCGNSDEMAFNPAFCIICGKEACCECTHKKLVAIEIKKPRYWAVMGNYPQAECAWTCPDCKDDFTKSIEDFNCKTDLATKYMSDYVNNYCRFMNVINRTIQLREKKHNA